MTSPEWRIDAPEWYDEGKRIATRLPDGQVVEGVLVHHPELSRREGTQPVWMIRSDACELHYLGDRWRVLNAQAVTDDELGYLKPQPGEAQFGV